jgi:hypothetical protein
MKINARKIWYGASIALSAIAVLLGALGIAATWVVEPGISRSVVGVLTYTQNTAGSARQVVGSIDGQLEQMQGITVDFSDATSQLSQDITDKGLVMTLLPEEKEQRLVELATGVKDTFDTISTTLSSGISLYRSIDQLPLVSLPSPSRAQIDEAEKSIAEVRSSVQSLQESVSQVRLGTATQVNRLKQASDQVALRIVAARERLSRLDSRLTAVQGRAEQLKATLPTVFLLSAIAATLFLAYVIYTQVEIIRLSRQRWQAGTILAEEVQASEGSKSFEPRSDQAEDNQLPEDAAQPNADFDSGGGE